MSCHRGSERKIHMVLVLPWPKLILVFTTSGSERDSLDQRLMHKLNFMFGFEMTLILAWQNQDHSLPRLSWSRGPRGQVDGAQCISEVGFEETDWQTEMWKLWVELSGQAVPQEQLASCAFSSHSCAIRTQREAGNIRQVRCMVADMKTGRCRDQAGKTWRIIFLSHKTLKW